MIAHLWAKSPAPPEYVELHLCREFHVLPSQLRAEPHENVLDILEMLGAEATVNKKKSKRR